MADIGLTRKLASIVAVDVAGYSAQAERDDLATAAAIAALKQRIEHCAAAHGGRVFNSAGDGFMLEFATATSALEAGAALLEDALALRVGVHVGEVSILPNGDLLGHGVNIAARLQQLARPRGLVASEDVHRSVRGPLAERLARAGSITLDKMQETLDVYTLGTAKLRNRMAETLRKLPRTAVFLAAAGLVVLIVAASLVLTVLAGSRTTRAAVFTFSTPASDTTLTRLADGVAGEIVSTMNEIGMETISRAETREPEGSLARARQLGAAFSISGDVARDDDVVRVSVRLDDVRDRATVWSQTYELPSAEANGLRLHVASRVVHVMRCAVEARREIPRLEQHLMVLLLHSCGIEPDDDTGLETLELARRFAAALPRSSLAQGRLAYAAADAFDQVAEPMREQLRQEALRTADFALRLNRRNTLAATAKAWASRGGMELHEYERLLLELLEGAPDAIALNTSLSNLLRSVGRNSEAVAYARRSLANNPLSPSAVYSLTWSLALTGQVGAANELLERQVERWPGDDVVWWARFRVGFWFGTPEQALGILEQAPPGQWTADEARVWRLVVEAMASRSVEQRRRAIDAVKTQADWDGNLRVSVLATLGDVDGAFEAAEVQLRERGAGAWWGMFFEPSAANLRRDPRFMPLMQRVGLVEYWRTTDRWPDFCAEPDLPFDCRAEAEHVANMAF